MYVGNAAVIHIIDFLKSDPSLQEFFAVIEPSHCTAFEAMIRRINETNKISKESRYVCMYVRMYVQYPITVALLIAMFFVCMYVCMYVYPISDLF